VFDDCVTAVDVALAAGTEKRRTKYFLGRKRGVKYFLGKRAGDYAPLIDRQQELQTSRRDDGAADKRVKYFLG